MLRGAHIYPVAMQFQTELCIASRYKELLQWHGYREIISAEHLGNDRSSSIAPSALIIPLTFAVTTSSTRISY